MLDLSQLRQQLKSFLAEDVGHVDLTSTLMIDPKESTRFSVRARENLVVAGIDVVAVAVADHVREGAAELLVADGDSVAAGDTLARMSGRAQDLLTVERVMLNILQRLCGIATLTARYVAALEGTHCVLLDTRKTTPGLRMLEKHAVTCGGGRNHRLGLDSGVMIKDNHIAVAGSIGAAVAKAKANAPALTKVEVECDKIEQVSAALAAGADMLLLDNMTTDQLREAVALVAGRVPLEASGGVTLETIGAIAATGVDFVSVGRITQSAQAVDIGLDAG